MLHVAAAEATTGDCAGAMREKASRWKCAGAWGGTETRAAASDRETEDVC